MGRRWIQVGAKASREGNEVEGWETEHNLKKERGEVNHEREKEAG